MFAELVQRIADHPRYGPAVEGAVARGDHIVLDYHTHGPDHGYCISICSLQPTLIPGFGTPETEELAHVRGFGQSEDQCVPLTTGLADALRERYGVGTENGLSVYLNGKPL